MKKIVFLLILFPILSFSQNVTKGELRKIINVSIKINNADIVSYEDIIFVADNTDSIFFSAKKLSVYTSRQAPQKNNFCRTVELKFFKRNLVILEDSQTCKEPSNAYVATEKNIFKYKILESDKGLYLVFKNMLEERKYKIVNVIRDNDNNISEIELTRD